MTRSTTFAKEYTSQNRRGERGKPGYALSGADLAWISGTYRPSAHLLGGFGRGSLFPVGAPCGSLLVLVAHRSGLVLGARGARGSLLAVAIGRQQI